MFEIRLEEMERDDKTDETLQYENEQPANDDDDDAAMDEMMQYDDKVPRAKASIRVKNEDLARAVRAQVVVMRFNRSKQGAAASKHYNMQMAKQIKEEEHEERMHAKEVYEQTVAVFDLIMRHMHHDVVDWFAVMDEMMKDHEQKEEQEEAKEHEEADPGQHHENTSYPFNFDELDEAEQRAASTIKPTWFDWDELEVREKQDRRKEWRSTSSISLEAIAHEARIRHSRWMKRQDDKNMKAMKEKMSNKIHEASLV